MQDLDTSILVEGRQDGQDQLFTFGKFRLELFFQLNSKSHKSALREW